MTVEVQITTIEGNTDGNSDTYSNQRLHTCGSRSLVEFSNRSINPEPYIDTMPDNLSKDTRASLCGQ